MERRGRGTSGFGDCSEQVIGACIEVHRLVGPGLLESAYEQCVAHELALRRLSFERQKPLPLSYKGVALDQVYRLDFVVECHLVLEIRRSNVCCPFPKAS